MNDNSHFVKLNAFEKIKFIKVLPYLYFSCHLCTSPAVKIYDNPTFSFDLFLSENMNPPVWSFVLFIKRELSIVGWIFTESE